MMEQTRFYHDLLETPRVQFVNERPLSKDEYTKSLIDTVKQFFPLTSLRKKNINFDKWAQKYGYPDIVVYINNAPDYIPRKITPLIEQNTAFIYIGKDAKTFLSYCWEHTPGMLVKGYRQCTPNHLLNDIVQMNNLRSVALNLHPKYPLLVKPEAHSISSVVEKCAIEHIPMAVKQPTRKRLPVQLDQAIAHYALRKVSHTRKKFIGGVHEMPLHQFVELNRIEKNSMYILTNVQGTRLNLKLQLMRLLNQTSFDKGCLIFPYSSATSKQTLDTRLLRLLTAFSDIDLTDSLADKALYAYYFDLQEQAKENRPANGKTKIKRPVIKSFKLNTAHDRLTEELVKVAYERATGNVSLASTLLDIDRPRIYAMLKKYKLR